MAHPLSERWNRIRTELSLKDLLLDVSGKMLVGLGVGVILAHYLQPYAVWLIAAGIALSAAVKAKYWKRFWA